jgi:hypothetical protein
MQRGGGRCRVRAWVPVTTAGDRAGCCRQSRVRGTPNIHLKAVRCRHIRSHSDHPILSIRFPWATGAGATVGPIIGVAK